MKELIGFKCLDFDAPALVRRSQVLRVPYLPLEIGKYRHHGIVDLMQWLSWDGLVDTKPLTVYCRLFGVDVPEDPHSGSDIADLYARKDWNSITSHCRIDVVKTARLAKRVGFDSGIAFDIETVANVAAVELLDPPRPDSRIKDPLKMALSMQDKAAKRLEEAALDIDTLRIIAVGLWDPSVAEYPTVIAHDDEADLLAEFWERLSDLQGR